MYIEYFLNRSHFSWIMIRCGKGHCGSCSWRCPNRATSSSVKGHIWSRNINLESLPCTSHRAPLGENHNLIINIIITITIANIILITLHISQSHSGWGPPEGLELGRSRAPSTAPSWSSRKLQIELNIKVKTQLTSSPLPHPEASSSKLSSGGSGLHHRSIAFIIMSLMMMTRWFCWLLWR